jgi:hypothetical protein
MNNRFQLLNEAILEDIVDALREKSGSLENYTPSKMAEVIRKLDAGGIVIGELILPETTFPVDNKWVLVKEENLINIADALREKISVTDKWAPSKMGAVIRNLPFSAGPVDDIHVIGNADGIYWKWTDPTDKTNATWQSTTLVRKQDSEPIDPTDGIIVLKTIERNKYSEEYYCDTDVTWGDHYYYRFFPCTTEGVYSNGEENIIFAEAQLDNALRQQYLPSNIVATSTDDGEIALTWTDPAEEIVVDGLVLDRWINTRIQINQEEYPLYNPDDTFITTRNTYQTTPLIIEGFELGTSYNIHLASTYEKNSYAWSSLVRVTPYIKVAIPSQSGTLTYTGNTQSPTWINYDSSKMTLSGVTSSTNAGTYTATFTLKKGYCWSDGSTAKKSVNWSIAKAAGSLTLSSTSVTLNETTTSKKITVTRAGDGAITASSSNSKIATVSVSGTTITISHVNKTSGSVVVTVKVAEGTNHTAPATKPIRVTANFAYVLWDNGSGVSWTPVNERMQSGTYTLAVENNKLTMWLSTADWGNLCYRTTNQINLKDYKYLDFEFSDVTVGNHIDILCGVIKDSQFINSVPWDTGTWIQSQALTTGAATKTYTFDISSLTGSYYIGFKGRQSSSIANGLARLGRCTLHN